MAQFCVPVSRNRQIVALTNPISTAFRDQIPQIPSKKASRAFLTTTSKRAHETFHHNKPFKLHLGATLPQFEIAYETWGRLNDRKDNAILLTTGLSASTHAKSHYGNRSDGWWERFIGPGLPLDTNRFHIICANVLGGCFGSTGPSSIDPIASENEGRPVRYATKFPMITVWDITRTQFRLLDSMGIRKLHAVVGSSMGGMTSLAAAQMYPERISRIISISSCARSHPYSIALRYAQRQVLMSDPKWNGGNYYDTGIPAKGLSLARQLGTITYRSGPEWEQRFGRKRTDHSKDRDLNKDFVIESYLDYQGKKWVGTYDANSLLYLSRAMDMFDMSDCPLQDPNEFSTPDPKENPSRKDFAEKLITDYKHTKYLSEGMKKIQCPVLVIGVRSDFLIPSWQQKEIATSLRDAGNNMVTHFEIDGIFGHDTFLLDFENIGSAVKGHLEIDVSFPQMGEWFI